ncbi:MAG: response regulator [Gammaproteobacteria bacterium]|nr:response regulator [Gammaproteobacteria bacterium]
MKKTALIIEDNPDNLILISDILEMNGYKTIAAEEGQPGFELAEKELPDFIILDIQLPDIDGYAVLNKLRASEKTQSIPVIAMTSYAMAGDRERLLNAGCNAYVEKPIDPGKVMDQIRQAIGET